MNLTAVQFEELVKLYGQLADDKQKKRDAILAKSPDEVERLASGINAAQDRVDALLPDDLSKEDRATLQKEFTFYHKHPAPSSGKYIDKILPGFIAYTETRFLTEDQFQELVNLYCKISDSQQNAERINEILPDDLSETDRDELSKTLSFHPSATARKRVDKILPGFAAYANKANLTLDQFQALVSLCGEMIESQWRKLDAEKANNDAEVQSLITSINLFQAQIDEILPYNLSEADRAEVVALLTVYYIDPPASKDGIDEILPGFSVFANLRPHVRPKPTQPAAPQVVLPNEDDISEFGQAEADFIATSLQKNYVNGDKLIQNYRQALRNGGIVRGVDYTRDDVNILRQSPEKITLFEQRISGNQQSVIDENINLTLLAISQCMEIARIESPYQFTDIYSSIKVQLREPLEQYQRTCERVFSDMNKGEESNGLFMIGFSSPTPENMQELKEAVALRSKITDPYKKHLPLIPSDKSNDIYGSYDYREFKSKEDQLAFILLLGGINQGEKGGLFRKGTPDEFLGVDPAKLQAYKDILTAALPRMIQKSVNLEYEKIFTEKKLAPDYLLFRNLYGGDVGARGFCKHCHQVGAEKAVSELLYCYAISSVQDIENAYGKELGKNSDYHRAVLAAKEETYERDKAWNEHVRDTVRDKNVMVAEPLKKKYIRNESYWKEGRDAEAEQLVQSRGMYGSHIFPPTR